MALPGTPIADTSGAILPDFMFTGLRDTERLYVMAQNPANNHHWSKPIGPVFTVAQLKRACAILDAAEALREALGPARLTEDR